MEAKDCEGRAGFCADLVPQAASRSDAGAAPMVDDEECLEKSPDQDPELWNWRQFEGSRAEGEQEVPEDIRGEAGGGGSALRRSGNSTRRWWLA